MRWLLSLFICAILAVGLSGCTVTVTSTEPGAVMEDGSVYLGFVLVSRKAGKDWMLVGQEHGYFSTMRFRVENRPFALDKMVVEFGDGQKWSAPVSGEIAAGAWSDVIQLPGQKIVRKVTFHGRARGKKGRMAKVSVYGQR